MSGARVAVRRRLGAGAFVRDPMNTDLPDAGFAALCRSSPTPRPRRRFRPPMPSWAPAPELAAMRGKVARVWLDKRGRWRWRRRAIARSLGTHRTPLSPLPTQSPFSPHSVPIQSPVNGRELATHRSALSLKHQSLMLLCALSQDGDNQRVLSEFMKLMVVAVAIERTQKQREFQQREAALRRREKAVRRREAAVQEHDAAIQKHEQALKQRETAIQEHDAALQKHEQALKQRETAIQEHDAALQKHEQALKQRETAIQEHDAALQKHEQALKRCEVRVMLDWTAVNRMRGLDLVPHAVGIHQLHTCSS
jgi:hypothetical protein